MKRQPRPAPKKNARLVDELRQRLIKHAESIGAAVETSDRYPYAIIIYETAHGTLRANVSLPADRMSFLTVFSQFQDTERGRVATGHWKYNLHSLIENGVEDTFRAWLVMLKRVGTKGLLK